MSDALNSQDSMWRERARSVLPNGMYGHLATHALPEAYPQFFSRGDGAMMWDVDGAGYIDFMCAFGPNLFGYGDREINDAYTAQMRQGDTLTGPSPVLVQLAEAMVAQVSHAEWALFCKNGGDATTSAVMAARAATGRTKILRARGSYHGTSTWCAPSAAGTTEADRNAVVWFDFNDVESLKAAVAEAGADLAAVIATPVNQQVYYKNAMPTAEYARATRQACDESGAMLIVDEVRTGFRVITDGIWDELGAAPDLSAWGKGIANGHCLSALLGNARARPGIEKVFVTGSYWFSAAPMAASLVVMSRIKDGGYLKQINATGEALRAGLDDLARRHGVGFDQTGPVTMPLMTFAEDPDLRAGFFWCTEMLKQGVYMHPWHNMFLNTAMTESHIDTTLKAADKAFAALNVARPTLPPNTRLPGA